MTTEIWLAICASLITALTGLVTVIWRDIGKKLLKLEYQHAKLNTAVVSLLVARIAGEDEKLVKALHDLISNGIDSVVIK